MKKDELRFRLNDAGRECLLLWIQHVAPRQAPKHAREGLAWLYRDFEAAKVGVGLMFQIRTVDCKTPADLRQRAQEAIDKLNEFSANGTPTAVAVARYKAWVAA